MPPVEKQPLYIGLDPGATGGIAFIRWDGDLRVSPIKDLSREDLWMTLKLTTSEGISPVAVLEEQVPRPTTWTKNKKGRKGASVEEHSTSLPSTCKLYGAFKQLEGFLIAAGIPFLTTPPQTWQKALKIESRRKDETTWFWKKRLKEFAQKLFPGQEGKFNQETADSVLLAHYCRLKFQETLGGAHAAHRQTSRF